MPMKALLSEKKAIITGARRGIGRQITQLFAENEANVWACIRKEDETFQKEIDFNILEKGQTDNNFEL